MVKGTPRARGTCAKPGPLSRQASAGASTASDGTRAGPWAARGCRGVRIRFTVVARLRVDTAARLSDMLNDDESYTLSTALVEGLDDGRRIEVPDLDLCRDELLLIDGHHG